MASARKSKTKTKLKRTRSKTKPKGFAWTDLKKKETYIKFLKKVPGYLLIAAKYAAIGIWKGLKYFTLGIWIVIKALGRLSWFLIQKWRSFYNNNFIDKYGRLDTGRIGQFVGIFLMIIAAKYAVSCLLTGIPIDGDLLIKIAGPGGILMTLYRMKGFTGESGNRNGNSHTSAIDKGPGMVKKLLKKLPKGG